MLKKQEILKNVNHMIERLSEQLSQYEIKNGWNEEIKVIWLDFFRRIKTDLMDGNRISKHPEYTLIFRGMDSHGIIDGELLEEAINISEQLDQLTGLEKKWWKIGK